MAFVWLATALLVLHPAYRAEGMRWLAPLGLGAWAMWAACAGELLLAGRLLLRRSSRSVAWLQIGLVAGFTVTLAAQAPLLLAHPFGALTKNLPLLAAVWCAWCLARDGQWAPASARLLRAGVAIIWITEGLGPKVLFQQAIELQMVQALGFGPQPASWLLAGMGLAQIASGLAVVFLRGQPLQALLLLQLIALIILPIFVTASEPLLWVHPFGPLTKNAPILAATWVLLRRTRCSGPPDDFCSLLPGRSGIKYRDGILIGV